MPRQGRLGRVTIGLYNSYDPVKFHEAHRRALARAGPIALAFDFNLATFGFPYDRELRTPVEIARWTADSTSIGEGGRYLTELAEKGRFAAFDTPKKGLPPQLGTSVATTRSPSSRATTVEELSTIIRGGKSICLLFGLGPRGLPRDAIDSCQLQLDITGNRYSLETCTALGVVSGALARALGFIK